MSKKNENVTKNVAKINEKQRNNSEMSFLDKTAYLYELGKQADKKHDLLTDTAINKLNKINAKFSNYPFEIIHNACNKAFDFDLFYASIGPLDEIISNLKVNQIHTINKALLPVLDANMMFDSLNGITSLDEMIKVCETFLNK